MGQPAQVVASPSLSGEVLQAKCVKFLERERQRQRKK